MDSIKNSQTVQQLANGPLADTARTEVNTTKNELNNLAAARHTPQTQTANGQNLTHYHSLFYTLLSWENPRATALSYVTVVVSIFLFRYFPLARYVLKATYVLLGITAAAEIVGKVALGEGFASRMRPKRYFTIPHEFLQSALNDAEELINFFVIEFQRIVFAENVYVTLAVSPSYGASCGNRALTSISQAFVTAFITYFLVKIMPTWGLALFFTTFIYFLPLAYIQNKEIIDEQINNAQTIVSEQAGQVRNLAVQHTNSAVEASQSAFKEYSNYAQELIGQGKQAAVDKGVVSPATAEKVAPSTAPVEQIKPAATSQKVSPPGVVAPVEKVTPAPSGFPAAPIHEPKAPTLIQIDEPKIGQAV